MKNNNINIVVESGRILVPREEVTIEEKQCKKCGQKVFCVSRDLSSNREEKFSVWSLDVSQWSKEQFVIHNLVCTPPKKKKKKKKKAKKYDNTQKNKA